MTYGEMYEQALIDIKVPRNIKPPIARPIYENRRLGNMIDWITDNFSECRSYYLSLPGEQCWDREAMDFMRCQYDSQVLNRDWAEKHDGEYRDQSNKDRYDRVMNSRDGEG